MDLNKIRMLFDKKCTDEELKNKFNELVNKEFIDIITWT